jgi:hypothetical protein
MMLIVGGTFDFLPLKNKVRSAVEVVKQTSDKRDGLASKVLSKLEKDYKISGPKESDLAWKKLSKAHNLFDQYSSGTGSFPPLMFQEHIHIEPPSVIDRRSLMYDTPDSLKSKFLANTQLQQKFARAFGILKPDETWLNFINRRDIKVVEDGQPKTDEDKDLILGTLSKNINGNFSLGGMPYCYEGTLVKYPDVKFYVIFDDIKYGKNNYNEKLDTLISNGDLTPRIGLFVSPVAFVA